MSAAWCSVKPARPRVRQQWMITGHLLEHRRGPPRGAQYSSDVLPLIALTRIHKDEAGWRGGCECEGSVFGGFRPDLAVFVVSIGR